MIGQCKGCTSFIYDYNVCDYVYQFKIKELCSYCDFCLDDNHCTCSLPQFFKSKIKFHKCNKFKTNVSTRFIAAEIEVAKIKTNKLIANKLFSTIKKWHGSVVYDGSLPDNTGFEITTAPANGDKFIKEINDICQALNEASGEVNKNCGLHVHVDARDFNFNDIKRLIKLYAAIEPALFLLVPPYRKKLRYCKPCGDKYEKAVVGDAKSFLDIKKKIVVSTYGALSTEGYNKKYNNARYNALNIHSWFYRGTIECRLLEGIIDADEIINWCVLWANILDVVLQSNDKNIGKLIKKQSIDTLLGIVKNNKSLVDFVKKRYQKYSKKHK